MTEQLRQELIAAQAARTDLLKYKLLVCAVLGAVAIGIGPAAGSDRLPQVVGIIPPVCLYIDTVCSHNDLRIFVIGGFLRRAGPQTWAARYERFAESLRDVFSLERLVLHTSTIIVSAAILVAGFVRLLSGHDTGVLIAIELGSGALGIGGSLVLHNRTRRYARQVASAPEIGP